MLVDCVWLVFWVGWFRVGWAQFGVVGFLGFELVFAGFLVFWVG